MLETSFNNWRLFLETFVETGYTFWTHRAFVRQYDGTKKVILIRHDADFDPRLRKTEQLVRIAHEEYGALSTVFLRLHDPDYNVLGYREMRVIREMQERGCEIGLHSETADLGRALGRSEMNLLKKDVQILEAIIGDRVCGIAPHRDITRIDNTKILNGLDLGRFGLKYQAYDPDTVFSGWYVSNSHGNNYWKRYINGELQESEEHGFLDYAKMVVEQDIPWCVFLIHPRPWHTVHYREMG